MAMQWAFKMVNYTKYFPKPPEPQKVDIGVDFLKNRKILFLTKICVILCTFASACMVGYVAAFPGCRCSAPDQQQLQFSLRSGQCFSAAAAPWPGLCSGSGGWS